MGISMNYGLPTCASVLHMDGTPCCLHVPGSRAAFMCMKVSMTWLAHLAAFMCLKINLPDMAWTPCPRNCLEMPENQAASLPCPGHSLHIVSQKLPRNAWKLVCIPVAVRTRPGYGLHTTQKLPKNA
ncbi:Hypothetical predicted protein [Olea europaea subsp. europaea]|uniref:Uncharacterized protein n=1 Tax=Olea europaea subsp. europaea TaxID=158383 RepID=A0A8S0S934_OLEEU|nr:Hypothetical predicted protein [Olea europaea subsp. europaea]